MALAFDENTSTMDVDRAQVIDQLGNEPFDVIVIGAGINGSTSAAALAASGARVALLDKGDFASNTSSNSSSLVWGGIKYLENQEYALVNKLCQGRNRLQEAYPGTVREVRFLTTIRRGFRMPAWFVYLGTWVYWLFGRMATQTPNYLRRSQIKQREPLIDITAARAGFEYSDCHLPDGDARFVFNFVQSCRRHGGTVANYVSVESAERQGDLWQVLARDERTGKELTLRSRVIVNACGPEVDSLNQTVGQTTDFRHLFSKGIHLIVDRLTKEDRVLTFFASDGRMFFVFPMGSRSCIGTTDTQVTTPHVEVTDEDRQFVLDNVNRLLALEKPLTLEDVIAERCGVRPLVTKNAPSGSSANTSDWLQLSRKHEIHVDHDSRFVSVFGGKLTDCVNVGEELVGILQALGVSISLPDDAWYGEPNNAMRDEFVRQATALNLDKLTAPSARHPLSVRLWRRYGHRAIEVAENICAYPEKADVLYSGSDCNWAELEFAAEREMIVSLDDYLRRRTDIALVVRLTDILQGDTLLKIAKVLFGQDAEQQVAEYLTKRGVT